MPEWVGWLFVAPLLLAIIAVAAHIVWSAIKGDDQARQIVSIVIVFGVIIAFIVGVVILSAPEHGRAPASGEVSP